MGPPVRPPLDDRLTGTELRRWYWLRDELVDLARQMGVPASGGKAELTDRLAAALDGDPVPPPSRRALGASARLPEPLTGATLVPPGQRATQQLRAWFHDAAGPGFRFTGSLRDLLAASDGTLTLDRALAHWRATRHRPTETIGEQFELNRFCRAWRSANPGRSHSDLLAAWAADRALPAELRQR